MPSLRFGFLALLTTLVAYSCKQTEPEPGGASGSGNVTSHAGASGGGRPSSGGAAAGDAGSAGDAGAPGASGAGDDGSGGEAGAASPSTLGTCSPNPCVVLATGQPYPRNLVVDNENVYWTNEGTTPKNHHDSAVMKVALSGGDPVALTVDQPEPLAIANDANNLYWTTGYGAFTLVKMPIGGGEIETLATDIGSWSITLDGDHIYDSSFKGLGLLSVPISGGTPEVVYPTTTGNIVFDSKNLYFSTVDKDGSLTKVAGVGIMVAMPKGGGDVRLLTSGVELAFGGADSLVLASDSLYWGDADRGTVETVKLDGTGRRIIASDQHSVFGIGADADYVYWTSDRQGGVLKAPLDGSSEPVQIAKIPMVALWGLTLDAEYIYVTVYDYLGKIVKIKK